MGQKKILFVCMGNICRSPTAEGVFRHKLNVQQLELDVEIDSAGTHAYHVGHPPDERAAQAASRRGISLAEMTARQVRPDDFHTFDWILCADTANLRILQDLQPAGSHARLELLMSFSSGAEQEVPDPYYGGEKGFERVLDLIEEACDGLIDVLRKGP